MIAMESDTSSSSSDEEANERFKAAAAEELISVMKNPDSGKSLRASECSKAATKEAKKSIRDQIFCETAMQDTVANTTPEFRAHVAKKLMKYFDGILVNKSASLKEVKTVNLDPGGVKLLSNSSQFVSFSNEIPRTVKPSISKRSPEISSSDSEDDCKFASVAVSGNDILQNGEGAFKR